MEEEFSEDSFLTSRYFREFIRDWKGFFGVPTAEDITQIVEKIKIYEDIHHKRKTLYAVVSFNDFKLSYIGKNVESICGYTMEECRRFHVGILFKLLPLSHLNFPVKALQWTKKVRDQAPSWLKNSRACLGGMKLRHKNGRLMRGFMQLHVLSRNNNGYPSLVLCAAEEITHLLKGDHYWGRFICGAEEDYVGFFVSGGEKSEFADMISEREKEVLQLIAANKSSQAISKELGIATNTVIKHRKNMIMRTGAKDTTALVQLCRMCEVF